MKKLTLLTLLFLAGCGDTVNVQGDSNKDSSGCTIDINYTNNGRVFNLVSQFDSLVYGNANLLIYSGRVYSIPKDSIINYIVK